MYLLSGFFGGYLFFRLGFSFFFVFLFRFFLIFIIEVFFEPLLAVDAGGWHRIPVDYYVGDVVGFELGVAEVDAGGLQGPVCRA